MAFSVNVSTAKKVLINAVCDITSCIKNKKNNVERDDIALK